MNFFSSASINFSRQEREEGEQECLALIELDLGEKGNKPERGWDAAAKSLKNSKKRKSYERS